MKRRSALRIVLMTIAIVLFGMSIEHKMIDHDAFFHIRCGLDMLTQGRIVMENIYAFTSPGYTFSNHAWLAKIVFALVYKAGGINAVNVFGVAMLAAMGLFLVGGLRSRRYFLFYWFVLCCGIILMTPRFLFRPQMFSFLLFLGALSLLLYAMRRNRPQVLYALIPLQLVWNQMHAFCVLGPVLVGCFLGGCLWEYMVSRASWRARYAGLTRHCTFVLLGVVISFMCMPRPDLFFRMYVQLFTEYRDFCFITIEEFKRYEVTLLFAIFVLMTMPVCIRFRDPSDRALTVLYIFFFVWTLTANRYVSYFVLVTLVTVGQAVLTRRLSHLPRGCVRWIMRRRRPARVCAITIVLWLAFVHGVYSMSPFWGIGVSETMMPVRAVAFMDENDIAGKGFCDFAVGSYLLFARPHEQVFIHNQVEAYDPAFINSFMRLYKDKAAMGSVLEQYDLQYALIEYRKMSANLMRWFAHSPRWALVYYDDANALFVRRGSSFDHVIDAHGVNDESAMPLDELRSVLDAARSRDTVWRRLHHMIKQDSLNAHRAGSHAARAYDRAVIMGECSLYHRAERLLMESVAIDPYEPAYVTALCQLYGLTRDPVKLEMLAAFAARQFGNDMKVLFSYAIALFEMDDPKAVTIFDQVFTGERKMIRTLVDSANSSMRDGQFERATKYFELVQRYVPNSPELLKTLGLLYVRLRDQARAIEALEHYLAERPADGEMCLELGRQYDAGGDLEQAKKWYKQAIELKKRNAAA